jgi:hypothetical protein
MATESGPSSLRGSSPFENFEVGDSVMIDLVLGIALLLVSSELTRPGLKIFPLAKTERQVGVSFDSYCLT